MGIVCRAQGKNEEALEAFSKTLDIKVKVVGQDSRDVADTKYNMAEAFEKQGSLEEARKLFLESAEIWATVLGEDDHDATVDARHRADTVGEEEEEDGK